MCLVEVERAPKPLPACATPVMEGMKVSYRVAQGPAAPSRVMEFLLINHPLDCPICDQGGECELQDLAMGYGGDVSQFHRAQARGARQGHRAADRHRHDPLHPLHPLRALSARRSRACANSGPPGAASTWRSAPTSQRSDDSELSGNVIDLCPVGALTSKPFRYSGPGLGTDAAPDIAPHDAVGSNLYAHV
jgi:NADH-quinone oxidoreductase subunit G